ncbi:protein downstream neighbor of son homolog [Xenentodon cancila]
MDQQPGYSPSFKRPAEILRMRRKRARSEAGGSSAGSPAQGSSSPACAPPSSPGPLWRSRGAANKRRNPFANVENSFSPKKKAFIYEDGGNGETLKTDAGGQEDGSRRGSVLELWTSADRDRDQDRASDEEEERRVRGPPLTASTAAGLLCSDYPADWSLKTRLLFTSPQSLSWTEQPRAQEEAAGLSSSCRAQFSSLPPHLEDPRSCPELRCAFQQGLVYWQHPSLPWLPLFPRINAERNFSGKSAPWAQDAALQQSLMREWSGSLSSLYSLLKSRLCPYFYVCSYQFTVLFRAAGVGGSDGVSALISPTTRGFREAMKSEGIEFSLPLVEEEKKRSRQRPKLSEEDEEEDEEERGCGSPKETTAGDGDGDGYGGDEGGFLWLQEMGVQDKIRKPDGVTLQLRREVHAVSVDHKPESVVCVEGSHTFTLINFLINCKSVVAAAGSQAGLPPTLLAPTAFRGATLHTLKSRHVNVKSQVGSTYQNVSSLEISGPVLPSCLHAITALLRPAQRGNFSAALYTHSPTAVMNVNATKQQSGGSVDLSGSGVQPASIQQLQQPPSLGKAALTHISMKDYSFSWRT